MPSRKKKPGSPSLARAVCNTSSAGEDWSLVDPLHLARSTSRDLAAFLATGDHTRARSGLVFLSPSSSGDSSSLSLQASARPQSFLTPTVVLRGTGTALRVQGIDQVSGCGSP